MRWIVGWLACAACTHSAAATPPTPYMWSDIVQIDDDTGPAAQQELSLAAANGDRWYAGWIDARDPSATRCGFAGSEDDGATWSASDQFADPAPYCVDPVVASGGGPILYRLGENYDDAPGTTTPGTSSLRLSSSVNGGLSWSAWHTVVAANAVGATPPAGLNDRPAVAANGQHVVVAWTVLDRSLFGALMATSSDDGGATWSAPVQIGQGVGTCLTLATDGTVHAAWGNDDLHQIQHGVSTDFGHTWSAPDMVGDAGEVRAALGLGLGHGT